MVSIGLTHILNGKKGGPEILLRSSGPCVWERSLFSVLKYAEKLIYTRIILNLIGLIIANNKIIALFTPSPPPPIHVPLG